MSLVQRMAHRQPRFLTTVHTAPLLGKSRHGCRPNVEVKKGWMLK